MKTVSLSMIWCCCACSTSFFMMVVPVIMRQQGFDLATIGFIYAVGIPHMLKWVFSPLFDRFSLFGRGERGWLRLILLINIILLLTISQLVLKPHFWVIFCLMLSSCMATQLLSTLCSSVVMKQYPQSRHSWLNGCMVSAMSVGMILGGGGLLYLYEFLAWQGCLLALAALNLLVLFVLPETPVVQSNQARVSYRRVITLFKKPGIVKWSLIMMLMYGVNQGVYVMLKPFMVDMGLANSQIALLTGLYSALVGMLAGMLGSLMVRKLGARYTLNILVMMTALATGLFLQVMRADAILPWLYPACTLLIFASFAGFTVIGSVSMSYCDKSTAATDFAIMSVLPYLGSMPFATLGGLLTEHIGYRNYFMIAALVSLLSLILIYWVYRGRKDIYCESAAPLPLA